MLLLQMARPGWMYSLSTRLNLPVKGRQRRIITERVQIKTSPYRTVSLVSRTRLISCFFRGGRGAVVFLLDPHRWQRTSAKRQLLLFITAITILLSNKNITSIVSIVQLWIPGHCSQDNNAFLSVHTSGYISIEITLTGHSKITPSACLPCEITQRRNRLPVGLREHRPTQ